MSEIDRTPAFDFPPARPGEGEAIRRESEDPDFTAIKAGLIALGAEYGLRFLEATFSEGTSWGKVVRARLLEEQGDVRLAIGWAPPGADEFQIAYAPSVTQGRLAAGQELELSTSGSVFLWRASLEQSGKRPTGP